MVFGWFISGLVILQILLSLKYLRGERWPWRVVCFVSVTFVLVGAAGFFGSFLASSGGLNLPASFEWPVASSDEALVDSQGRFIVPLVCDRIQLYGKDREFIRGWFVQAHGGVYKIHMTDTDKVEVFTARGDHRYLFDLDGTLVEEGQYPGREYGKMPSGPHHHIKFSVHFYEYPFTHPMAGWATILPGAAGMGLLRWRRKRRIAVNNKQEKTQQSSDGHALRRAFILWRSDPDSNMLQTNENEIERELMGQERLLWTGRPRQGFVLHTYDFFLIPFSLLWGGGAIFFETVVIVHGAPLFPMLFGIPFVLLGLYIIFGRFYIDVIRRERTFYGFTDQRIIIISGFISRVVKSLNLRTLSDVSLIEKADHSGTITFGPTHHMFGGWGNMQWPGMQQGVPSFEMITNAKEVYEHIREAQSKKSRGITWDGP